MGLLRAIIRIIGKEPNDNDKQTPIQYPSEDKLSSYSYEEILVTVTLLIISYFILATPWTRRRRRNNTSGWGGYELWVNTLQQVRHVRSIADLKLLWYELKQSREQHANRNDIDTQQIDELLRQSRNNPQNSSYDMDKTIRATGSSSKRSLGTPLRSFFRPLSKESLKATQHKMMHPSTSDGNLLSSPSHLKQRFTTASHGTPSGATNNNTDDINNREQSFTYEDFGYPKLETDHDRFQKAWQTQIRFAEYRRLVLPPTCKLVEFQQPNYNMRQQIEHTLLENLLLDESKWKKLMSWIRNFYNVVYGICAKLLNKESTARFSTRLMQIFRYRIRKQRGLSVDEDDDTDDEDDGSVATWGSVGKRLLFKTPTNLSTTLPEGVTPVASNRKIIAKSKDMNAPPLQSVPNLSHSYSPKPTTPEIEEETGDDDENDNNLINVPQSVRPRFNTASDINDDATQSSFMSASGLEHPPETERSASARLFDIPSSVAKSPKNTVNVSPLPKQVYNNKQKKKDALDNYRKSVDLAPIIIPSLKSNEVQPQLPSSQPGLVQQPPETVSPMPSPKLYSKLNPKTNSNPELGDLNDTSNLNFFDTANSSRQLRDMSRAVPIPDASGYILGDEFLPSSCMPLLVFVNTRSGPQQGNLLITQFRQLLNPIQVWDLANGGPEKILKPFSVLSRFQLLICGGDGTVSWVISALEKMNMKRWPPIGILPLGTGNDLARIHGWGGGYNNESLLLILRQISDAYISMLDLWELDMASTTKKGKQKKEVKSFMNYLGVGVDAQAALQVHNLRESKPKLFFSRFFNKTWYAIAGGEEAIKSSCANLSEQITLVADGVEIPLPADSQGIIFLNIDSYSGGVHMWAKGLKPKHKRVRRYSDGDFLQPSGNGLIRNDSIEDLADLDTSNLTACDLPSSCQDGLLDVVSIRGTFHLGQIRVGLSNAQLLCQCRAATITLKKKIAVQIDGEPWRQNPSTLQIVRKPDRATMLHRSPEDSGGVETEVTKLLNWANEKRVIDQQQYAKMMEEFSRRIEYKKRTQQEKGNGFSFV